MSQPIASASPRFLVTVVSPAHSGREGFGPALVADDRSRPHPVRYVASAASVTYPLETVHAIVFDVRSLSQISPRDVETVRRAAEPGTCRVYRWAPDGIDSSDSHSTLDDVLQKTLRQDTESVAEEIARFFGEADALNRRATYLGTRDAVCITAYQALQPLWLISYLFAGAHVINAIATLLGRGPWPALLASPYVVPFGTFFGAFFLCHSLFRIGHNFLFSTKVIRQLGPGFLVPAGVFATIDVAIGYSIATVDGSALRIAIAAGLAGGTYQFYLYALRIRAECSSLSAFQAEMTDLQRRDQLLDTVGGMPISPDAFPLVAYAASPIFISYMHRSEWSRRTAHAVHRWALAEGRTAFLDGSSIPPGGLWRQHLLRALSECGTFVAVLDGKAPATEWVLAESAYAAALRKQIGKPRILLVAEDSEAMARLQAGPFGALYADIFRMPADSRYGANVLVLETDKLDAARLEEALARVRPMSVLG